VTKATLHRHLRCGAKTQDRILCQRREAAAALRAMGVDRRKRNERWAGAWGGGAEEILRSTPPNPMDHSRARRLQARCGASTATGTPCQRPAIRGRKRCRLHGGLSPGAPRGQENGNFKTGNWTLETIEERNWLRSLVRSFAKPTRTE
jgi:hypothetical protein